MLSETHHRSRNLLCSCIVSVFSFSFLGISFFQSCPLLSEQLSSNHFYYSVVVTNAIQKSSNPRSLLSFLICTYPTLFLSWLCSFLHVSSTPIRAALQAIQSDLLSSNNKLDPEISFTFSIQLPTKLTQPQEKLLLYPLQKKLTLIKIWMLAQVWITRVHSVWCKQFSLRDLHLH